MSDMLWNVKRNDKRPHACAGEYCQVCKLDAQDIRVVPLSLAADWKEKAELWFKLLSPGANFTSEDLTDAVGMPAGEVGMNRNNAVGSFILVLRNRGAINKVTVQSSRKRSSHGATLVVWRKM